MDIKEYLSLYGIKPREFDFYQELEGVLGGEFERFLALSEKLNEFTSGESIGEFYDFMARESIIGLYETRFAQRSERTLEFMAKNLPRDVRSINEVGSGYGLYSNYVALVRPDAKVRGFDLSGKSIEIARKRAEKFGLTNVDYKKEDFFSSKEPGAQVTVCLNTVHEISPPYYASGVDFSSLWLIEKVNMLIRDSETVFIGIDNLKENEHFDYLVCGILGDIMNVVTESYDYKYKEQNAKVTLLCGMRK